MLRDRKIAVFIDVDNAVLDNENYAKLMDRIRSMGEIVCGTVYNTSERKHKLVIEDAREHGYSIMLSATGKRRARKVFDNRIFVDVATLVTRNTAVDTVAVISAAADMVYLFSYLRRLGLQVIAPDDLEENSLALVSEKVHIDRPIKVKPVRKPAAPKAPRPAPAPRPEPQEDKTAEIMRNFEQMRDAEEPEEKQPSIADETQDLFDKMAEIEEERTDGPHASYVSQNDGDLIRKIEELRKQNEASESDDLIDEIKNLLDGLD